jgi:hypothetical protein
VLQLAQQAACRQWHGLEARLGRWLLMTHDRAPAEAWPLTQAFLATLLGVRRESVTQAAQHLQAQQLIHYRRGQLRLLDRAGLARVACPCSTQMQAYGAGPEACGRLRAVGRDQPPSQGVGPSHLLGGWGTPRPRAEDVPDERGNRAFTDRTTSR